MAEQIEILNSDAHRNLAMHPLAGPHPHMVQIVVTEVTRAAACCPVVLAKSPETGRFALVALFGFQPGEVLVEGAEAGNAAFLPLDLQRQGFFTADDNIAIDLAHPRFAPGGTVPLFDAMGGPSDEMRLVQRAIGHLMGTAAPTEQFIAMLVEERLIEPVDISLSFDDGQTIALNGLYSVSGEALSALEDATIIRLFRQGWLQAALAIHGSLQQVGILARRRNERLAGGWN
ncbi:SapC family protein [Novosphingobium sp. MD-1]|uniref:SapC family protein n=1 Tax=Novosphingobium sp. MD-1 TaxID=1630648 RepID=UPI00061CBC48|nr:SapC family protein [Novosphingobium sp. MD-1]GAO53039.1 sapC-like S-layer protein [Novosphingobium sp. MD-1]